MFPSTDKAPVVLAIVGATELQADQRAVNLIENAIERYGPSLVISGGAPGIDTMSIEAADRRGIPWREYLPDVKSWEGKWFDDGDQGSHWLKGFKDRNLEIAEACTHLVRIAFKKSKTYGSGFTRDAAARLGKPVEEFCIG
jgi:hypothetical protein